MIDLLEIFSIVIMSLLEANKVKKIVVFADLHKQPIRMLAFSFVPLLEMS